MKKRDSNDWFRIPPEVLKLVRVMKIVILFLLVSLGQLSAIIRVQGQRLDLQVEQKSLIEVMDLLKAKSGFSFIYSASEVEKVTGISIRASDKSVGEILDMALKGTKLSYKIEGELIILKQDKDNVQVDKRRYLSGVVLDQNRDTLAGVTIRIKGSFIGITTNAHGRYGIYVPEGSDIVICYSFVGKKMKEISYTGQKEINVILEDASEEIGEVVVTGYQKIDKRHLTSAVTTIKPDDIMLPGVITIDKMLESHVPGMIFMQNSGQVGAAPKLRIRGTSTVLGTQEPLWVVDGIIQTDPVNVDPSQINDLDFVNLLGNAISGLNPNDIEQIDVLKDASATALYGSRAANGVIVITTKKGKPGPPAISYSFAGTFSARPRYTNKGVNVMNSLERIDYSREIIEKGLSYPNVTAWVGYEGALMDYWSGKINFAEFQRLVGHYESVNTDWFDVLCRDAFSHNHTLSVSGGSQNVKYYASLGYSKENGTLQQESGDRYTANIKITLNHKRFTGQFGLMGNVNEKNYTPSEVGLMGYAYNSSRAIPAYNEDGSLWFYNVVRGTGTYTVPFNILNDRAHSQDGIKGSTLSFNATLGYSFTDALKADLTMAYSVSNTNQETYLGEKTSYAGELRKVSNGMDQVNKRLSLMPFGGELRESNTRNENYTARFQLNYNKFLDSDNIHLITVALGGELSSSKYNGFAQTHRCYIPERGKLISPVDVAEYPDFTKWLTTDPRARGVITDRLTNMVSGYGTVSYSYDDRYIFNANVRIDASNKFGSQANKKLLPVWSASVRWNTKNDVLENVKWVNDLALRGSFGYQGNMLDTESPELIIKRGAMNTVFGEYESAIHNFPNPNLRWEKTASFNGTLDFSLFNNKLRGSASYYYKKTKNAFITKNVSIINGTDKYTINQGTLENKGFELSLNFTPIDNRSAVGGNKRGFSWRIDPQIGQVLNKLIDKAVKKNEKTLHDDYTFKDYLDGNAQIVGRPLNSFYSYEFDGLSHEDGRPVFKNVKENHFDEYSLMSKEKVFTTVMEHSGCRVPYIQGGISNTFSYGNFVLSFNLAYSIGSKVRLVKLYSDAFASNGTAAPQPGDNVRREFVDRWKRPGDEKYTNIPGLLSNNEFKSTFNPWWKDESYRFADNIWQMYNNADIRVVTGNYLKVQNLSLRYTIPGKLCKQMKMQSAYVSFSGSNIYTWCHKVFKGQDPTSQSGSSDLINVPVQPTYTFSLSVTF